MKYARIAPKKVYIETIMGACNRRRLDAQKLSSFFENNGCEIIAGPQKANIILLFTCAVSVKREDLSINRVFDLKKFNGELIICGCLPVISKDRLAEVHDGTTIPTSELLNIDEYFPGMTFKYSMLEDSNTYFPLYKKVFSRAFVRAFKFKFEIARALSFRYIFKTEVPKLAKRMIGKKSAEATPYPVRVSWGCNRHCAYCSITDAVGEFRSKPLAKCIEEFKKGYELGHREFEIIADDIGAYGVDIGTTFPELIRSLFALDEDFNILIWNLSPVWFIKYQEELLPLLKQNKITRIHYPLQTGSSKMLKEMKRFNNVDKITESLIALKRHSKDLVLTTDIIVGYPGETEEDFNDTVELMTSTNMDGVGIFKYNDVANTAASKSTQKVDSTVIDQRARKLEKSLKRKGIECGVV